MLLRARRVSPTYSRDRRFQWCGTLRKKILSNGDPLAVAFYDITHEGAQVRAIAGAIEASLQPQHDEFGVEIPGLASLAGVRARSIVVLCADNLSYRCAQLAASLTQPLPVALVIAETIPGYLGALDVLIVVSEKGEDAAISRAISQSVSRGITTVLVCPGDCPMASDAPRGTIIVRSEEHTSELQSHYDLVCRLVR